MKPDIIKDEILDILESLDEQIPVLIDYTDRIPQIELDIVLSNLRRLYENIIELKYIDNLVKEEVATKATKATEEKEETALAGKEEEATEAPEEKEETAVAGKEEETTETIEEKEETAVAGKEEEATEAPEEKEDTAVVGKEEETTETIEEKEETAVAGKEEEATEAPEEKEDTAVAEKEEEVTEAPEEKEEVIEEEFVEAPVREPVKIVFETKEEEIISPKKKRIKDKSGIDLFSTPETTVADKFKDEPKSINERILDNREDKSIAAKMQKEQIKDLKLAIGLNEKFLFINELFGGDMKSYSKAIDLLNEKTPLEEAIKTLNEMKEDNKWDESSDSFKKLLNLLERKL